MIRFFERHRWLLSDPRFAKEAKRQKRLHSASLARAQARVAAAKAAIRKRNHARRLAAIQKRKRAHLAALRRASPRATICTVFGSYCREALQVARCESGLATTAQNGQYQGLFQMGSSERHLFGHGPSVREQTQAAYRYFVASGRDWSPWSCKPWS